MKRQLPDLAIDEQLFLDNSNLFWRNVLVPNCIICGKKHLGRKIISVNLELEDNFEFAEFIWETYEKNIPVEFTETFLREELGIRIDIYKFLEKDRPRMEEIRVNRKRRMMDDIEQSKHYDGIPKTPEEIAYANAVNKAKLMIVSRTQREYNIQQEQKIDVTGNLAQVIIPAKNEE